MRCIESQRDGRLTPGTSVPGGTENWFANREAMACVTPFTPFLAPRLPSAKYVAFRMATIEVVGRTAQRVFPAAVLIAVVPSSWITVGYVGLLAVGRHIFASGVNRRLVRSGLNTLFAPFDFCK